MRSATKAVGSLALALSDESGVLSVKEGRELSRAIEELETRTGVRMVMVIAETTEPARSARWLAAARLPT